MGGSYTPRPMPQKLKQGMAITSLVLGVLGLPSGGCVGVGGLVGVILGIVALVKANSRPNEYGGKGLAIGGIVTSGLSLVLAPFMIGIIAAIAIPSLLRARVSANEAAAIGDIRTFISAEVAYQSSANGVYGTPECLAKPAACIPNYQGPTFLDAELASLRPKAGYKRTFVPGPSKGTGLSSFALILEPVQRNQTGVRAFCGDASGVICQMVTGFAPTADGGACDLTDDCRPLQ